MEEIQYEIGGVACFAFRKKSGFETVCNELFYGSKMRIVIVVTVAAGAPVLKIEV